MATRFYIHSGNADGITPAFTGWDGSTPAVRRSLFPSRIGVGTSTVSASYASAPVGNDLVLQAISPPILYATTLTGTVKGVIYATESAAATDAMPQMRIRVVSNDGTTFRGTALDFDNSALSNEFALTNTSRLYPRNWTGSGATLTDVSVQVGDRIVVEVGARVGTIGFFSLNYEVCSTTTDAPENETDTSATTKNGWVEFSQDFIFAPFGRNSVSGIFANINSNQSKTTGTTLALLASLSQPQIDDIILVGFASDPASGTYSCADDAGNSYRLVDQQTNGSGTSGVTVCLFAARCTTALTSAQNITITHPSLAARAATAAAYIGIPSNVEETFSGGNTSASPASAGNITPSQNFELVVGACGIQNPATTFVGAPTNYIQLGNIGTTGGGAASNIGVLLDAWVQATATTTDNPVAQTSSVLTADTVACWVGLPAPPSGPPYDRQPLWNPLFAQ